MNKIRLSKMKNPNQVQGISWADLTRITSQESLKTSSESIDYTSNVLLQITLPIVLILALIIFTKMRALENFRDEVTQRPGWEKYEKSYLELQKQVLLKKLEEVKSERRTYLGTDSFLMGKINIESGRLDDSRFMEMCQKTYYLYASERSRNRESNSLYEEVLKRARQELRELAIEKELAFREITPENKQFVKKEIEEFVEVNINTAIELQLRTFTEINSYFRAKPYQLKDERLSELMIEYASASEKDKPELAAEVCHRLRRRLKSDLESQGYNFLPDTWQKVLI